MNLSLRILLAAAMLSLCADLFGQKAGDFDPMGADIEANIKHPAVPSKHSATIAKAMSSVAKALKHAGYQVEAVRSGEVIMVTIPCADLFAPNSTTLLPDAPQKLRSLNPYIKESANFKTILAVHSDDTGDETYRDRLTSERANAIDDYFYNHNGSTDTGIIPYGLGSDEPLKANTSISNRAANRRVEFYFVPTETFIKNAR